LYLKEDLKSSYYFQIDVLPLIQTKDEENYATVVGYSAFLHCEFFASPEAIVTW
jgi:neuropilin 2